MTPRPAALALIPTPRRVVARDGSLPLGREVVTPPAIAALAQRVLGPILATREAISTPPPPLRANRVSHLGEGAYRLSIGPKVIAITSGSDAGTRHAIHTLAQIMRGSPGPLPALDVEDAPSFPMRGVMLDISRCRVPTMETLYHTIDLLEHLKVNHLQLYTEHTFAYAGHEDVWRDASPITPDEARELDAYCARRGIELCPNQNTLGHMERWLRHPRYADLAETHGSWNFETGDGRLVERTGPFSLCPTDPGSIELIRELLSQLLPCFSSGRVNIGCDEAFDIGAGRSREECDRRGRLALILDHISGVDEIARSHGKRTLYWADMLLRNSTEEWVDRLPEGSTALAWGYEADMPFNLYAEGLRETGIDFWLCPGTSTWCSFTGRTGVRATNITNAARAGAGHAVDALLTTCWGDHGHRQQWPVDMLSIAHGVHAAWNADRADEFDPRAAAIHLFEEPGGELGALLDELGDVDRELRESLALRNANALFTELNRPIGPIDTKRHGTLEQWAVVRDRVREVRRRLESGSWERIDPLLAREVELTLWLAEHATDKAVACRAVESGDPGPVARIRLAADLGAISEEHRAIWLERSRPGGLDESASYYERVIDDYETPSA